MERKERGRNRRRRGKNEVRGFHCKGRVERRKEDKKQEGQWIGSKSTTEQFYAVTM